MIEEHKEDKKYIVFLIVITAIIAGIVGYGYYVRQNTLKTFCIKVVESDIISVKAMLKKDHMLINTHLANGRWQNGTPLFYASNARSEEMAEFLISEGADVNAKDKNGMTSLHIAAFEGNKEVVKVLLAHNADVNARANNGCTPLGSALKELNRFRVMKCVAKCECLIKTTELLRKHGGRE